MTTSADDPAEQRTYDQMEPMADSEQGTIAREEWERRYAARIMERAGWPEHAAIEAGRVGAEEYARGEREAGNVVVWSGIANGNFLSPEECADAEMTYWDDDREEIADVDYRYYTPPNAK